MSDEINFNEQQRLKEQSQQKTKKQKKTKFHLTKVLSYDMMVVARKYTRRKEAHRSG